MSQADALRQRSLEKARQQLQDEMRVQREQITKTNTVSVGKVDDRFTVQHEDVQTALGRATVGLVSLSDFKSKQSQLQEKAAAAAAGGAAGLQRTDADKKRAKRLAPKPQALSFAVDDDADGDGAAGGASNSDSDVPLKKPKLLKNPDVDTSFLPDRDRERLEQIEREKLASTWREQQERIKKENIEITYSFWDGTGHRAKLVCKKGDSVSTFLDKARYARGGQRAAGSGQRAAGSGQRAAGAARCLRDLLTAVHGWPPHGSCGRRTQTDSSSTTSAACPSTTSCTSRKTLSSRIFIPFTTLS